MNAMGHRIVDTLAKVFTWWNGQTLNTRFSTWRFGEFVGADDVGNKYYRTAGGKIDVALGFERRWVIYPGYAEASSVPPGWYGWLHHTSNVPPTAETYTPKEWQKPHKPNMTGDARSVAPARVDPQQQRPAARDGRLRGLVAGGLAFRRAPAPLRPEYLWSLAAGKCSGAAAERMIR